MKSSQHQKSSSGISLPSIHEMFPEHLMKTRDDAVHSHRRNSVFKSDFRPYAERLSNVRHPTFQQHSPGADHGHHYTSPGSPETAYRGRPTTTGSHQGFHDDHDLEVHSRDSTTQSGSRIYSYNVLRSDPTRKSLQHLTSSATLPNRGANGSSTNASVGVASGSSPAFRVSVPSASLPSPDVSPSHSRILPNSGSGILTIDIKEERRAYPAIISFPAAGSGSVKADHPLQEPSPNPSDEEGNEEENNGKKHVCPTCSKRFNRPSSLRIHVNTHTGATPFRCPWPSCGREFNVNSNMRRHYRNHTTPGFSRAQSNDSRRRRRNVATPQTHVFPSAQPSSNISRLQAAGSYMPSPPISTFCMSEDSDECDSDSMEADSYSKGEEEDELLGYESQADHKAASYPPPPSFTHMNRVTASSNGIFDTPHHPVGSPRHRPYPQGYRQSSTPGSICHSPSPSPSLSPSPSPSREQLYTPSAPYLRSVADQKVSTALRPAFHTSRISSERVSRSDRMSDAW